LIKIIIIKHHIKQFQKLKKNNNMKNQNTATAPRQAFKNIAIQLINEDKKRKEDFLKSIDEETEYKDILNKWQYSDYLTATTKKIDYFHSVKELKAYIVSRRDSIKSKELNKQLSRLNDIQNAKTLRSVTINITWNKSKMWGNNPTAEAIVYSEYSENFQSGSIGGCGYDKESTAVANVLNQSNEVLKLLYTFKNKKCNVELKNQDVFSYGAGYGITPSIEGGVGVSCYNRIFNKVGYKFFKVSSGKTFDVYKIEKMTAKERKQAKQSN
jgi:hypothetical protein